MKNHISVFKPTTDYWGGNYIISANYGGIDAVEVYLKPMEDPKSDDTRWIIVVSGYDDSGMILNKEYPDEWYAQTEFITIIGWAAVNQKYLIEMGFKE